MGELSLPWAGIVTGDAGPYSDDDWSDTWRVLFQTDRTDQGIIYAYLNELAVTGATSPVAVDTGAALVDGKYYENDASLNVTIPSPVGATRIDRIVLRKSWSAQTVRITRIAGAEGGAAPALVQVDGTTWDVPLYQVSIAVGGAITLTDERVNCGTPLADLTAVNAHIAASANVHGLPASVNVLGNRNAAGEFIQHGVHGGLAHNVGPASVYRNNATLTFPVAFSATPIVVQGSKETGTAADDWGWMAFRGITTTQVEIQAYADANTGTHVCAYIALGT